MGYKETSTSNKFRNSLFLLKINYPAPLFLSLPVTISLILSSIYWDASVQISVRNLRKEEQIWSCLSNSQFKIIWTGSNNPVNENIMSSIHDFLLAKLGVSKRSRDFNYFNEFISSHHVSIQTSMPFFLLFDTKEDIVKNVFVHTTKVSWVQCGQNLSSKYLICALRKSQRFGTT